MAVAKVVTHILEKRNAKFLESIWPTLNFCDAQIVSMTTRWNVRKVLLVTKLNKVMEVIQKSSVENVIFSQQLWSKYSLPCLNNQCIVSKHVRKMKIYAQPQRPLACVYIRSPKQLKIKLVSAPAPMLYCHVFNSLFSFNITKLFN